MRYLGVMSAATKDRDLMMPFGPIDAALGRDEVLSAQDAGAVHAYCRAMGERLGCPEYERYLFDLPVDVALLKGFRLHPRALRETTPYACAEETARFSMELLENRQSGRPQLLELCTGIGQSAFSYAKAGYQVKTVENHELTRELAEHNLELAGVAYHVECVLDDAVGILKAAVKNDTRYAAVHMDPPWGGNYDYDTSKPFRLDGIALDVRSLIADALKVSGLVVLNMPHNVDLEDVGELGLRLACDAVVQYQRVSTFTPSFGQAPVYFIRAAAGRKPGSALRRVTQALSLAGERLYPAHR
jgi:16S rRNA G966 N2-methylase RsmD